MEKNEKFTALPETFVIFITEHDILGDGEQIYHVERVALETNKIFGDGAHIIYVNGSYKDDSGSALGDLIHDFFCENPADMKHRQLAERVAFIKNNEQEERKMCKIMEDIKEEARNEAKKETLLDNIRNAMESWGLTAEAAMKGLKIPEEKQKELLPLI